VTDPSYRAGVQRAASTPPRGEILVAAGFAAIGASLAVGLLDGAAVAGGLALTVVHSGALAWRRRSPEAVLAVQAATAVATVAAGWPPVILGPALLASAHGLGATRDRDRALGVLAATILVMALVVAVADADIDTVITNAVALGAAWWLGDRQRRTQQLAADAAASADSLARRAVAAERQAIARELHDVVAHALSVIAVQAGTGRVVIESDTATARSALASIEHESRAALDEMRRLLAVLRSDDDDAGPLEPAPGLDDIDALVASTIGSGLPVDVTVEGEPARMPAGADLAAYRIVQEALTNVRRHAGASHVDVRITWCPAGVELEVTDDGRGGGVAAGGGHGLVGMRERAALYGGWVEAGDRPGGGYRVAAHIPAGASS
jgi:signal transduction histidine kinase